MCLYILDFDGCFNSVNMVIFEGYFGLYMFGCGVVIKGVDQWFVLFCDEIVVYFLCLCQFIIIGIEFFVQYQEFFDLGVSYYGFLCQVVVDLIYMVFDYGIDIWMGGQFLVGCVIDIVVFCLGFDCCQVDVQKYCDYVVFMFEGNCFFDVGEEFEFVFNVFGCEQCIVVEFFDIFCLVDDFQMVVFCDDVCIFGVYLVIFGFGFCCCFVVFEIFDEYIWRLVYYFIIVGDF